MHRQDKVRNNMEAYEGDDAPTSIQRIHNLVIVWTNPVKAQHPVHKKLSSRVSITLFRRSLRAPFSGATETAHKQPMDR